MRRGEIIELWGNRKGEKKIVFCAERASLRSSFLLCAICTLMTGTGIENEVGRK